MSMLVANQPILLQIEAAQVQKSAGNAAAKAAAGAKAANSSSTVALSSSATAAMARPAHAGGGTNSADGAKSRGPAKADSAKTTESGSASASKQGASSAAHTKLHAAYNANQQNGNAPQVAMFEESEDDEPPTSVETRPAPTAPSKAARENVMATYSSLAQVSLAADVKLKKVA